MKPLAIILCLTCLLLCAGLAAAGTAVLPDGEPVSAPDVEEATPAGQPVSSIRRINGPGETWGVPA